MLPTISANVSVWPTEPESNPLGYWLQSLVHIKAQIAQDVTVLPAHGKPFQGAQERIDSITAEQDDAGVMCYRRRRDADRRGVADAFLDSETGPPILRRACKCAFHYALHFEVHSEVSSVVPRPVFHK